MKAGRMSFCSTPPCLAAFGGAAPPPRAVRTLASMSKRPVSELMGRAWARVNFMPLYSRGLWLAVTMMPPSTPSANGPPGTSTDVLATRPISMTSAPAAVRPFASAAVSSSLVSRTSWPTTTRFGWTRFAYAKPINSAIPVFSCSGTFPRTSYALKHSKRGVSSIRNNLPGEPVNDCTGPVCCYTTRGLRSSVAQW